MKKFFPKDIIEKMRGSSNIPFSDDMILEAVESYMRTCSSCIDTYGRDDDVSIRLPGFGTLISSYIKQNDSYVDNLNGGKKKTIPGRLRVRVRPFPSIKKLFRDKDVKQEPIV